MWLEKVTLLILLLLACVGITMAQKSPGTGKVCAFGRPKMTSSNTPLACITDADCGDTTYRCVQRRRYTISKVCCLKMNRNGKGPHARSWGKTRARGTTMVMK